MYEEENNTKKAIECYMKASETELQTKDNHKSSKINKTLTKLNASSYKNCYPDQINLIDVKLFV